MNHSYRAEFASGFHAKMTVSMAGMRIEWRPDVPRLDGQARRRFLRTYRTWRDECLADFAAKTGITVAVVEA